MQIIYNKNASIDEYEYADGGEDMNSYVIQRS